MNKFFFVIFFGRVARSLPAGPAVGPGCILRKAGTHYGDKLGVLVVYLANGSLWYDRQSGLLPRPNHMRRAWLLHQTKPSTPPLSSPALSPCSRTLDRECAFNDSRCTD